MRSDEDRAWRVLKDRIGLAEIGEYPWRGKKVRTYQDPKQQAEYMRPQIEKDLRYEWPRQTEYLDPGEDMHYFINPEDAQLVDEIQKIVDTGSWWQGTGQAPKVTVIVATADIEG